MCAPVGHAEARSNQTVRWLSETPQLLRRIDHTARKPKPFPNACRQKFGPSRGLDQSGPGLHRAGERDKAITRYSKRRVMRADRSPAPFATLQLPQANDPFL